MNAEYQAVDLQPSFVLHQRPYRETSLLLEVFAVGAGRTGLIAKGARRPKSPFRMQLEPFRPLLLSWRGRGELAVLVGAEPDGPAPVMPPAAIASGLYVNELLVRLLHRHDPHPELFHHYRQTVAALADPAASLEQGLRFFEKRLLAAVGYGLLLDRLAGTGSPVLADRSYRYLPDQGPVEREAAETEGVPVSGSTLLALAAERPLSAEGLRQAKQLMRTAINVHLAGRPLLSRALVPRPFKTRRARGAGASPDPPAR